AARIPDGRLPSSLALEPCELAALVEQAMEPLRPQAQNKALNITVDVPSGLPLASCDRERITRVLGWILANAVRRAPRGGAVSARASRLAGRGRASLRSVVEDGCTEIAPEDRVTIFTLPSAPPPGAPRRPLPMTPVIALFVARGIVEAHGGTLDLESDPA